MSDVINVIINTETGQVIAIQMNDEYIVSPGFGLVHFENGVEPVFTDDGHGNLYLKPNAMIITDY